MTKPTSDEWGQRPGLRAELIQAAAVAPALLPGVGVDRGERRGVDPRLVRGRDDAYVSACNACGRDHD